MFNVPLVHPSEFNDLEVDFILLQIACQGNQSVCGLFSQLDKLTQKLRPLACIDNELNTVGQVFINGWLHCLGFQ